MMHLKNIILLFLALGVKTLYAQDYTFSQFYNAPLYTNPAFAGSAVNRNDNQFATRIGLNMHKETFGLKRQIISLSADKHVSQIGGGLGAFFRIGNAFHNIFNTTSLGLCYAPTLQINKKICVKLGAQFNYVHATYDTFKVFQPSNGLMPTTKISYTNANVGAIIYGKNIHAGFAIHNIGEPNESFYPGYPNYIHRRFTLHGGANIKLSKNGISNNYFQPYILYFGEKNYSQLIVNSNFQIGKILFGAGMRQTLSQFGNVDAAIGVLGYKAPKFQVTYSYDINLSNIKIGYGKHEIAFFYLINLKNNPDKLGVMSPSY